MPDAALYTCCWPCSGCLPGRARAGEVVGLLVSRQEQRLHVGPPARHEGWRSGRAGREPSKLGRL
eukprot:7440774-Alexandrium_andersonii.AAC.1